jgi:hypothetical protein
LKVVFLHQNNVSDKLRIAVLLFSISVTIFIP